MSAEISARSVRQAEGLDPVVRFSACFTEVPSRTTSVASTPFTAMSPAATCYGRRGWTWPATTAPPASTA